MRKVQLAVFAAIAIVAAVNSALAGPLARIYVKPGNISFRPGTQQQFQAYGTDLMDNVVPITEPLTWSTTAGKITPDGLFTAGTTIGRFWQGIKVTTPSGLEGIGAVYIDSPALQAGYMWERSWGNCQLGQTTDPAQLAIAPDGSVYVPDRGSLCVQHFDADGRFLDVLGFRSTPRVPIPRAVAFYGGYTYVAYTSEIAKFDASGKQISLWGSFGSAAGQFSWISDMTMDRNGNFYVLEDSYLSQRVQKFSNDGTFIKTWGSPGSGDGQFSNPNGICVDAQGNVYVADSGNNCIQKFDSNGKFLAKWADLALEYGDYYYPNDITIDEAGNLYVTDTVRKRTFKLDSNGNMLDSWLNDYNQPSAYSIAVDKQGNMYTANIFIQKRDSAGKVMAEFGHPRAESLFFPMDVAVTPDGTVSVCPGFGGTCRFDLFGNSTGMLPVGAGGLCVDSEGSLYTSTYPGINKYSPAGSLLSTFDLTTGIPGVLGFGRELAVAPNGDIYSVYSYDHRIVKLGPDGKYISGLGGQGSAGGQFNTPLGAAVDSEGYLYVTDSGNNRIQKFDSTGKFITQWGAGSLNSPWGICVTQSGSLAVTAFNKVVLYSTSGTLLGSFGTDAGGMDNGYFAYPTGIAVDAEDSLYVADHTNSRIQKFRKIDTSAARVKKYRDGEFVALTNQVVSAGSSEMGGECLYIESTDRSSGIRVTGVTSGRGAKVTVTGTIGTLNGERVIAASSLANIGAGSVMPVALTNKALGGADLNFDPSTGTGQRGVEDGEGANNVGLLVTITGKVTGCGSDFFYVDDGTHARDGSVFVGVRVLSRYLLKPAEGSYVSVTGISRISKVGDRYFRAIAPRLGPDIKVVK